MAAVSPTVHAYASQNQLLALEVSQDVPNICAGYAREFIERYLANGPGLLKQQQASLKFSCKEGVKVLDTTDDRLKQTIETRAAQLKAAMSAENQKYFDIKTVAATAEEKKKAEEEFPDGYVFIDLIALNLLKKGQKGHINVNIEVIPYQLKGDTTASLCYPHVLLDMLQAQKEGHLEKKETICLLAPGYLKAGSCPQLVELQTLFQGGFLVLSPDPVTRQIAGEQVARKVLCYDPSPLQTLLKEPVYEALVKEIKSFLQRMSQTKGTKAILNEKKDPQMLKIQTRRQSSVMVGKFEVSERLFQDTGQCDVMVAIKALNSMLLKEPADTLLPFLNRLFTSVKKRLYIDTFSLQILRKHAGKSDAWKALETELSTLFSFKELPLPSHIPHKEGALFSNNMHSMHVTVMSRKAS